MKPFDLAPNEWWKVPETLGSKVQDVFVVPSPTGTQTAVCDDWCGAVYDPLGGDIVLTNGGHNDYYGNEGYAFSINPFSRYFLKWRIKWYYSPESAGANVEAFPDGSPSAAHTYCGLVYEPSSDRIYRMPGVYTNGTTGGNTIRTYSITAGVESPGTPVPTYWQRHADTPTASNGGPLAAYDPVTKFIWMWTSNQTGGSIVYKPATDTWTQNFTFANFNPLAESLMSVAIKPGQYWAIIGNGLGNLQILDMVAALGATETWAGSGGGGFGATGATAIEGAPAPGFVWDGNSFVGWAGLLAAGTDARDLYYLDIPSKVWTRVPGVGEIPTAPNTNGTFSKFVNCGNGLCALFNATSQDVYFVRTSTPAGNVTTAYLGMASRLFAPDADKSVTDTTEYNTLANLVWTGANPASRYLTSAAILNPTFPTYQRDKIFRNVAPPAAPAAFANWEESPRPEYSRNVFVPM